MIKLLEANYVADFKLGLIFSDGTEGVFDASEMLKKEGSLLCDLKNQSFFKRAFVDAGALCWPNGLELSPARLHEICTEAETA